MAQLEKKLDIVLDSANNLVTFVESIGAEVSPSMSERVARLEALIGRLAWSNEQALACENAFFYNLKVREEVYFEAFHQLTILINPMGATFKDVYVLGEDIVRKFDHMLVQIGSVCNVNFGKKITDALVNRSVKSFGYIGQTFTELLRSMRTSSPSIEQDEKEVLQNLSVDVAKMNQANSNVHLSYANFQHCLRLRDEQYLEVKRLLRLLKKEIQQQFGASSLEYKLANAMVLA
jgi:hypothetical protein